MVNLLKYTSIFLVLATLLIACKSENTKSGPTDNNLEKQINTKFFDEISPVASSPCFHGAYYRKAVSSTDNWLGIEGKVKLPPTLNYDSTRVNLNKLGQYLDNASIYLGGNSDGQETDIGMTWEVIKDANGNVSTERKAFRPFLRRTWHKSGQTAIYKNAPAESKYYWYPGDTIIISILMIESGKLKFTVFGSGKNYEEIFDAAGYQYSIKAQYKRVNAIDQVSNEGKPVQATTTKILGAKWFEVFLYRYYKSEAIKVPMHHKRYTDMRCPGEKHFDITVQPENTSAETIDIYGTR